MTELEKMDGKKLEDGKVREESRILCEEGGKKNYKMVNGG